MRRLFSVVSTLVAAAALHADPLPGQPLPGDGMLVRPSSTCEWDTPETHVQLVRGPVVPCAFHTAREKAPSVLIKLAQPTDVTALEVTNRADGSDFRTKPLVVSVSADGKAWTEVFRSDTAEPKWSIALAQPATGVRWVKLALAPAKPEFLHLSRVVIHAR